MKKNGCAPKFLGILLILLVAAVAVTFYRRHGQTAETKGGPRGARAFPVETAPVERGVIEERRVFSGTLSPSSQSVVAPKVSGRITHMEVDLADPVEQGQVVVRLDDDEYREAVSLAEANLAVALAQFSESTNRLDLARRERERVRALFERGIASASALDAAEAEYMVRESSSRVAQASARSGEASLETARIRLGYTAVTAAWSEGGGKRVVAERMADEGDTVAANTPLLSVVGLNPVQAVFFVPERDYSRIAIGQAVDLAVDAYPGQVFPAKVSRIAPVFQTGSRQARVEVLADNPDLRLRPGMFARATVTLAHLEDVITVPETALGQVGGETGIFMVDENTSKARWVQVTPGLRGDGRVQLVDADLRGQVVTLGQHMLEDGAALILPEKEKRP
jgi:RND family efflux transporter MFP subunit